MAKKKWYQRIRWKVAAPILACLVLFIYLVVSLIVSLFSHKNNYNIQTICSYNGKQTYAIVTKENRENPTAISDYNFFGESLNLYFERYSLAMDRSATMANKQIALVNQCNDEEILFDIPSSDEEGNLRIIDKGIQLASLKDGFYSIYLKTNDKYSRFYYATSLDNVTFNTVNRNGSYKKIELIADSKYFDPIDEKKDEQSLLDKDYLYLNVTSQKAELNEDVDLVISTSPALTSQGVSLVGEKISGLTEGEAVYQMALDIQSQLAEKGLNVLVAKNAADEDIQYYGVDGVLYRAYNSKAKYFIHLDMVMDDAIGVYYSRQSSDSFARAIFEQLYQNTSLYSRETQLRICGSVYGALEESSDLVFDDVYELREAGGVALGTGLYSQSAAANAFASQNRQCMNSVNIVLYDLYDGAEGFNRNKENASIAIANGIIKYLEIK